MRAKSTKFSSPLAAPPPRTETLRESRPYYALHVRTLDSVTGLPEVLAGWQRRAALHADNSRTSQMDATRQSLLLSRALAVRREWVLGCCPPPPPHLLKADVLAYLDARAPPPQPSATAAPPAAPVAAASGADDAGPAEVSAALAALRADDLPLPSTRALLRVLARIDADAIAGAGDAPAPAPARAIEPLRRALLEVVPEPVTASPVTAPLLPPLSSPGAPPAPPSLPVSSFVARMQDPAAADAVKLFKDFLKHFCETDFAAAYGALPDTDGVDYAAEDAAASSAAAAAAGTASAESSAAEADAGAASTPTPGGAASMAVPVPLSPGRPGGGGGGGSARRERATSPAGKFRSFVGRATETLRTHALWRSDAPAAWDATGEAVERFLCASIAPRVIGAHPRAAGRDAALRARLIELSWVSFSHLDLPVPSAHTAPGWHLAQVALRAVETVRAPADKLLCIMNACRILSTLLAASADEAGRASHGATADEFLPALIYTVIHAAPRRLYSHLRFIQEFRAEHKLLAEEGYFFTNVSSAVHFVRRARARDFSVDEDTYAAQCAAAAAQAAATATSETEADAVDYALLTRVASSGVTSAQSTQPAVAGSVVSSTGGGGSGGGSGAGAGEAPAPAPLLRARTLTLTDALCAVQAEMIARRAAGYAGGAEAVLAPEARRLVDALAEIKRLCAEGY